MRRQSIHKADENSTWRNSEWEVALNHPFRVSGAIAGLLVLALIWAGLSPRNTTHSNSDVGEYGLQTCPTIESPDARLRCYDRENGRIWSQPAKGANAPSQSFQLGQGGRAQ